ncbi:maintenance protein tyrosine kinase involved in biofilm formation [Carnobacterium maltaromaticum]|uniref:CpsD/CapB family tyrosine-protein kinase n=1 Tax=Carnobacterium maltaromaticum TaxID=2751 RepID=UPI00191BA6AA|nr:CpsD/CapB family tyrosine-protein kinase [Carnobacterium maltaromaticum]CAD5897498.1 maintenance protein tyrosine kinase involved in biofilm formation [Carnobacterium maltaromaticum]
MAKKLQEAKKLIVSLKPKSPIAEQFRSIRTSIEFASVNTEMKVLVVTSSEQNSGKSLISSNLAVTFAQKGLKTLLIDADLRNPSVKNYFYLPKGRGLSSLIKRKTSLEDVIYQTDEKNLFILPPGFVVPNPADMLGSENMEGLITILRQSFDQIIIDTPPILVATDAVIVSTFSDGIIVVVRSGKTNKQSAKKALRSMNQSSTPIIGTILNDVKMNKHDYYYASKSNRREGTR